MNKIGHPSVIKVQKEGWNVVASLRLEKNNLESNLFYLKYQ